MNRRSVIRFLLTIVLVFSMVPVFGVKAQESYSGEAPSPSSAPAAEVISFRLDGDCTGGQCVRAAGGR